MCAYVCVCVCVCVCGFTQGSIPSPVHRHVQQSPSVSNAIIHQHCDRHDAMILAIIIIGVMMMLPK